MYDYKLRQDDFGLRRPKRLWLRRLLVRVGAVAIAAAAFYAAFHVDTAGTPPEKPEKIDANIIPLTLPPLPTSSDDARPIERPAKGPSTGSIIPAHPRVSPVARAAAATAASRHTEATTLPAPSSEDIRGDGRFSGGTGGHARGILG